MNKKYLNKNPQYINNKYLNEHAEEIIKSEEFMSPDSVSAISLSLNDGRGSYFKTKRIELGNYMRMEGYMDDEEKNMDYDEAYDHCHCRLNREYAKKTGHWDLFIWE